MRWRNSFFQKIFLCKVAHVQNGKALTSKKNFTTRQSNDRRAVYCHSFGCIIGNRFASIRPFLMFLLLMVSDICTVISHLWCENNVTKTCKGAVSGYDYEKSPSPFPQVLGNFELAQWVRVHIKMSAQLHSTYLHRFIKTKWKTGSAHLIFNLHFLQTVSTIYLQMMNFYEISQSFMHTTSFIITCSLH